MESMIYQVPEIAPETPSASRRCYEATTLDLHGSHVSDDQLNSMKPLLIQPKPLSGWIWSAIASLKFESIMLHLTLFEHGERPGNY